MKIPEETILQIRESLAIRLIWGDVVPPDTTTNTIVSIIDEVTKILENVIIENVKPEGEQRTIVPIEDFQKQADIEMLDWKRMLERAERAEQEAELSESVNKCKDLQLDVERLRGDCEKKAWLLHRMYNLGRKGMTNELIDEYVSAGSVVLLPEKSQTGGGE